MENPYEVLGITPNASEQAIYNAYRELAKRYHPSLQTVVKLRPWAIIGLALWMLFSLGYGVVRGAATELDGVVVGSYRTFAPLTNYVMPWRWWRSARKYVIRRPDGSEQRFVVGPLCTLLSGASLRQGTRIHKAAWQRTYELDGRTVSDFSPGCAVYLPVWLLISLSTLTIGIMDWATKRDAMR